MFVDGLFLGLYRVYIEFHNVGVLWVSFCQWLVGFRVP